MITFLLTRETSFSQKFFEFAKTSVPWGCTYGDKFFALPRANAATVEQEIAPKRTTLDQASLIFVSL